MRDQYLELTDWRRRVAALFAEWRSVSLTDPEGATLAFRDGKDRLFREHPQSPLPPERRAGFRGLPYWLYDPAYRMGIPIERADERGPHDETGAGPLGLGPIALPSSGSGGIAFRRIGRVGLTGPLEGHALSVFWIEGYGGGIFLPFRDATSGNETYGAGRYALDTIKSADHGGDAASGTLVVDLNMSFHPSCAYDPRWSCPLAPPENRLAVPVPVGERL
jgi:uncharacterized protein (DUF1684 family)